MRKYLWPDRLMVGRSDLVCGFCMGATDDDLVRSRDSNAGRAPIFRNVDSLHPFVLRLCGSRSPKDLWSKSPTPPPWCLVIPLSGRGGAEPTTGLRAAPS